MNPLMAILQKQIMSNPKMQNPACQNAWRAFQSGDINKLQQIADNLCQQNGIALNDAISQ